MIETDQGGCVELEMAWAGEPGVLMHVTEPGLARGMDRRVTLFVRADQADTVEGHTAAQKGTDA